MIRKLVSPEQLCRKVSFLLFVSRIYPVTASIAAMSSSNNVGRDVYVPPDVNEMTSDAKYWYLKGDENAKKNLDSFESIATKIKEGKDFNADLKSQLQQLLGPVSEANDNTKVLVPRLSGLIDSLHSWSEPPISIWSKLKLKTTIWYIQGKRDNKSYYLQNGGGLWCKLRVQKYLEPISSQYPAAKNLGQELNGLKEDILYARDMLDEAAQVYVQGMKKLTPLVQDICKNEQEIWKITQELKTGGDKSSPTVLKSAQDSVDKVQQKINSL